MSLYALGLSTTRPRRSTCASRSCSRRTRSAHALRDLIAAPTVKEAAILSTCNRTEIYFARRRARAGRRVARGFHHLPERFAVAVRVHAAARTGGDACVPRRERARLDGAGRAADPGPDEAGGALRRVGGLARPRAEPAVPAHVRRGEGRAHADRHRQRVDLDGRRGGEARRAHLSRRCPSSGCC